MRQIQARHRSVCGRHTLPSRKWRKYRRAPRSGLTAIPVAATASRRRDRGRRLPGQIWRSSGHTLKHVRVGPEPSSDGLRTGSGLRPPRSGRGPRVRRSADARDTRGGMCLGQRDSDGTIGLLAVSPSMPVGWSRPSRPPSHRTDTATAQSSSPRAPGSLGIQPSAARLDGCSLRVGIGEARRVHSGRRSVLAFALFPAAPQGRTRPPQQSASEGKVEIVRLAQGLSRAPMAAAWWSERSRGLFPVSAWQSG